MMKIRTIITFVVLSLFIAGVAVPTAFARERETERKKEHEEKTEERTLGVRIRADVKQNLEDLHDELEQQMKMSRRMSCAPYGHFIAPGWMWNFGTSSPNDDNCWLPRGIQNKWWWGWGGNRGRASSTDTTAPVISAVRSWPFARAAFVSWVTDEPADSAVFWSTTTPVDVNSSSTPRREQGGRTRIHQMIIPNLSATTTYYAVVRSRDGAGNSRYSSEFSFTTHGRGTTTPPSIDTTPPVISSVILTTGTSTMNVSWATNEAATSRIFYSSSTPVIASTTTTPFVESGMLVTSHTLGLSGLSASSTYYIRVQSADAAGNIQTTGEFSTTTAGL